MISGNKYIFIIEKDERNFWKKSMVLQGIFWTSLIVISNKKYHHNLEFWSFQNHQNPFFDFSNSWSRYLQFLKCIANEYVSRIDCIPSPVYQ